MNEKKGEEEEWNSRNETEIKTKGSLKKYPNQRSLFISAKIVGRERERVKGQYYLEYETEFPGGFCLEVVQPLDCFHF